MRIPELSFQERVEAMQTADKSKHKYLSLDLIYALVQELREHAKALPDQYDLPTEDDD